MRRLLTRAAAAAALSVLAVACGSSDNNASPSPSSAGNTGGAQTSAPATSASTSSSGGGSEAEIEIEGFQYTVPASVSPGASIKVVNKDGPEHSVTSGKDHSQFDTDVEGGETATFNAPNAPGSYDIICKYHASMHGTLVVK